MRNELRIHVEVEPGEVDLHVLESAIDAFLQLARGTGHKRWIVSELRLGSVELAARLLDSIDVDAEFERMTTGLEVLREEPRPPAGWSDELLEAVVALGRARATKGVKEVGLRLGDRPTIPISREIGENAGAAFTSTPISLGAVTGKVDRFVDRDSRRNFGLVDEATGDTVSVRFGREWAGMAPGWIGQRVNAWGELRRTPNGKKAQLILEDIEVLPARGPGTSIGVDAVVGALGEEWTGGMSSVEWVRRQRGE